MNSALATAIIISASTATRNVKGTPATLEEIQGFRDAMAVLFGGLLIITLLVLVAVTIGAVINYIKHARYCKRVGIPINGTRSSQAFAMARHMVKCRHFVTTRDRDVVPRLICKEPIGKKAYWFKFSIDGKIYEFVYRSDKEIYD